MFMSIVTGAVEREQRRPRGPQVRDGLGDKGNRQFVPLASDSRFLAAKAAEEAAVVKKSGAQAGKLPAY